jgi:hypothetical protein
MLLDTGPQYIFNTSTYQIHSPDGLMFVIVMEDENGNLCGLEVKVGKAGGALRAWAHCFGRLLTMCVEKGWTLEEIIEELSSQTSDSLRTSVTGVVCRSGPEAVYLALLDYRRDRYARKTKALGINGSRGRGPRMAR